MGDQVRFELSQPGIAADSWNRVSSLVSYHSDPYAAATNAHAVVICTEWDAFVNLDYNRIYSNMAKPAFIFDGRKILNHDELIKIGFHVETIGKRLHRKNIKSLELNLHAFYKLFLHA